MVSVLLFLAAEFGLDLRLSRDSPDSVVSSSYRRVAREVHPDKGGNANTAKELFLGDPLEASLLCSKVALADSVEDPLEASPFCDKAALADSGEPI